MRIKNKAFEKFKFWSNIGTNRHRLESMRKNDAY
jgi:hypothetical protein